MRDGLRATILRRRPSSLYRGREAVQAAAHEGVGRAGGALAALLCLEPEVDSAARVLLALEHL